MPSTAMSWFTPAEPAAMSPVMFCAVVEYVTPLLLVIPTADWTSVSRPMS